ncbi:diazepam-binding inhibitor gaba receptor acyl- -binding [Fusarium longipes]|uniref:Diazepam-binding inhibitor gaba receptor acyl--binding n=1 Tax=Fusarium longipes TaxID=694270 RepID=A0A395RJE8_9HYPO|nr:diazepam-binding inhibitor gaba receptor acyl- -binding [Fusarium longipes]
MSTTQSEPFKKAIEDSKKLTSKPGPNELLELYALYKGKAKYNAWKKVAEEDKLTPDAAQTKYVELVESLKEKYGYDANKVPEAVGAN